MSALSTRLGRNFKSGLALKTLDDGSLLKRWGLTILVRWSLTILIIRYVYVLVWRRIGVLGIFSRRRVGFIVVAHFSVSVM